MQERWKMWQQGLKALTLYATLMPSCSLRTSSPEKLHESHSSCPLCMGSWQMMQGSPSVSWPSNFAQVTSHQQEPCLSDARGRLQTAPALLEIRRHVYIYTYTCIHIYILYIMYKCLHVYLQIYLHIMYIIEALPSPWHDFPERSAAAVWACWRLFL